MRSHAKRAATLLLIATGLYSKGQMVALGVDDVEVALAISTNRIRVEDPLFVKVLVTNRNAKGVQLNHSLSCGANTIHFEIRRLGEADFREYRVCTQGVSGGFGYSRTLLPKEMYASHEVLCRSATRTPFPRSGKHELRARVKGVRGVQGVSKPVTIEVSEIPAREQVTIEKSQLVLLDAIGLEQVSSRPRILEEVTALRNELSPSLLRSTLDWVMAIIQVREARSQEEFNKARARLEGFRKDVDPVTRQRIAILVAHEYIVRNELRLAQNELAHLECDSNAKRGLEARLESRRRKNLRENPVPQL